jgi:hypothetical protein
MNSIFKHIFNLKILKWVAYVSICVFLVAEASSLFLWYSIEATKSSDGYWDRLLMLVSKSASYGLVFYFLPALSAIALIVAIFTSLLTGGFIIRRHVHFKRGIALVMLGILLGSYSIYKPIGFYLHLLKMHNKIQKLETENIKKMRSQLESERNISESVEHRFRHYAQSIFWDTGECVEFPTTAGTIERFQPTDKDWKILRSKVSIDDIQRLFPYGTVIFLSVYFAISVAMAILLPSISRRRIENVNL